MEISLFDQLLRISNKLPGVKVLESRRPDAALLEGLLRIECPAEIIPDLSDFLAAPGGLALAVPVPEGQMLIGSDGTVVVTTLVVTEAGATPTGPNLDANRFWGALYRALGAVGRGEPFTAHSHLEECRSGLLSLYRAALAPQLATGGWTGLEALPGADKLLGGLTSWLVCGLDARAQWRCAHRLAAAYEALMLPLSERLGLPYPWPLRNLVFGRLDALRPAQPSAGEGVVIPEATEPPPPAPSGPARFKVKARRKSD